MEESLLAKQCEIIFPKLKESEGERIRKELIAFLKENHETGRADETWSLTGIERWIAWLEKQGGKESDIRYKYLDELLAADDIYQMSMNEAMTNEARTKAVSALSKMCISELLGLEKQGEQNYEFQGIAEPRPAKGKLNELCQELSQSKVTKKSDKDDDLDAIKQAVYALEAFCNEDEPNKTFAGYHLSLRKAIERLESLKQRMQ
jgi:hypothetical protein